MKELRITDCMRRSSSRASNAPSPTMLPPCPEIRPVRVAVSTQATVGNHYGEHITGNVVTVGSGHHSVPSGGFASYRIRVSDPAGRRSPRVPPPVTNDGLAVPHASRTNLADLGERGTGPRFLLRDRDSKYTDAFDAVFTAEDTQVLLSAPRAPRMNAHCERVIDTIRREAPDHILILGESHARKVLTDYQDHYNGHRPHRSRQKLPPSATEQPAIVHDLDDRSLLRTRVLGGIINEYRYAA
ncbi:integrase core domain-containing protein [Streptomyces sp. NPDC056638]|uniref:integrase core domain-containing protein n=1 Tax=Streptomyces sp. NPDC056638 TaxID=3345887 RepID=UPI0036C50E04